MAGKTSKKVPVANVPENVGGEVVLLSGGNPQIAKEDGDAPVQGYIAAMPGWKSDVGRRLDDLIVRIVPNVRKAVRWTRLFMASRAKGGSRATTSSLATSR